MFLSVVIPAYNEEHRIAPTLEKVHAYLSRQDYAWEIVVVDDGSRDKTASVVEDAAGRLSGIRLVRNEGNCGKGFSVKHGMLESRGDVILFSDADLSTPIEEVEKLLPWLDQGYDVAVGSRGLRESEIMVRQPLYRQTMGQMFNVLVQLLVMPGIKDTQCGFKCFSVACARAVFPKQTLTGFGFDVEVLYIARTLGYKIKEVPIRWINSPETKVHALRDSWRMFTDLIRIRMAHGGENKPQRR